MRSSTQELPEGIRELAHITLCKATHAERPSTKESNPMKTRRPLFLFGAAALALSSVSLIAGPGPQYWQSLGKPAPAAKQVKAGNIPVCPGSELVPMTVMKPAMANGKGPLTPVQIGTERVCHVCKATTVVTTNDWPNHRGPLVQKVVETKAGATHVCTVSCQPSSKS